MPVDIQIPTSSTGRILRVFQRLRKLPSRELYAKVGAKIVELTKRRFKTKRSPEGLKWKDWSDAYAASRPAGKTLLVDEGDLERSIESRVAGDRLQVYSTVDYAGPVHKNRPFFGLASNEETELMDLIEDQARRSIGGA